MTPEFSPAIQTAIAELEAQARLCETRAGVCRDTAATLREVFRVSVLGPVDLPISPTMTLGPVALPAAAVNLGPGRIVASPPVSQPAADAAPRPAFVSPFSSQGPPAPMVRPTAVAPAGRPPVPVDAPRGATESVVRTSSAPRDGVDEAILLVLREFGGPLKAIGIVDRWPKRPGDPVRPPLFNVQARLKVLVADGRVIRTGKTAATRFHVPGADPVAAPIPVKVPALAPLVSRPHVRADDDEADRESGQLEPINPGRLVAWLARSLFVGSAPFHIGDIVMKVNDHFGAGTLVQVNESLAELVRVGELEHFLKGGEAHYRRKIAAANGLTTLTKTALKDVLMSEVFGVAGRDFDFAHVLRSVSHVPGMNAGLVQTALDDLSREHKIGVRQVGLERRYARRI